MKTRSLVLGLVALLLAAALDQSLRAEEPPKPATTGVSWLKRLDAALVRAKEENKPVLVFCYAWHSSAAKHLKSRIYRDAGVAQALQRAFVPLYLNPDAIDSRQSGSAALSRFGIRMLPTHLVLAPDGTVLITERAMPASDPGGMVAWLEARARDVTTYRERVKAVRAQPKKAAPRIELMQLRLELATRIGRVGGHLVVNQPPASAHNRQIDGVIKDAKALADRLDKAQSGRAYQAWVVWGHASLAGGVNRAAALARLDGILDTLAQAEDPVGAVVAFNTAYALFANDPAAARPYLARLIKMWPKSESYWQARVYEAYSYGRTGDREKARTLFEAIVKQGPAGNSWVQSAKKQLRELAAHERKRKGG